jgi:organic radical activating enzyme
MGNARSGDAAAPLVELFASFQGEGPYAGAPQLFLRFARCNLRCGFCDTPGSLRAPAAYRAERVPFGGAFRAFPNPCRLGACAAHLRRLAARSPVPFHALALTGGEPLLHAGFLSDLLPRVRPLFRRVYLDTNATLPRALAGIVRWVDMVSLGVKLPSGGGPRTGWAEAAAECLRIARRRDVFIKVVLTRASTEAEVARVAGLVAAVRPGTTLVLQPATPVRGGEGPPGAARQRRLLAAAAARLDDVRVLPQLHPLVGWR